MKKSASIVAIASAGLLALAGCSGTSGATASNSVQAGASAPIPAAAIATGPIATAPIAAAGVQSAPIAAVSDTTLTGLTVAADSGLRLITAQGIGTVTGTPDVVTISLGVETKSASAQSALDENNRLANDVINVVKEKGVAPEDLQTSQLSIYPSYDDKNTITGYQVTNMVTAKLRDIAGAGALIDAVGQAAGDAVRVNQLAFSIDNDSTLRGAARADAVRQAQAQAKQLADAAGIALGPIHSITESPTSSPVVYAQAASADAAAGAVPIQAGSQELTVSVQVVYEIAQ